MKVVDHDHLHPMSPSVIVREIVGEFIYKQPLIIHKITSFEQFNKLLSILLNQKNHIGQTDLNNDSSRSHIIYKFKNPSIFFITTIFILRDP